MDATAAAAGKATARTAVIKPNVRGMTFVSAHILPIVHHQTVRTINNAGEVSDAPERPMTTTHVPAIVPSIAPD